MGVKVRSYGRRGELPQAVSFAQRPEDAADALAALGRRQSGEGCQRGALAGAGVGAQAVHACGGHVRWQRAAGVPFLFQFRAQGLLRQAGLY